MLWVYFIMTVFPLPLLEEQLDLSLIFSRDKLVGFLVIKLPKGGGEGFPKTGTPGVFTLKLVHAEPLAIVNYSLGFPTKVTVLVAVSASGPLLWGIGDSLYLPVSLTNFGGSGLLCDLSSLMDLRRAGDF